MEEFYQSLAKLLPKGLAWPTARTSVQRSLVAGLAKTYFDLHEFCRATYQQWLPQRTATRLAEWEEACGLPDPCMGGDQTEAQRRTALLRRLRGPSLPYDDSSLCAPGVIEEICASVGYQVQVRYNTPFRVGRDRVGDRLGALDGRIHVIVKNEGDRFRVGVNRVGDRLIRRLESKVDLECYLLRILPARFEIVFTYV